MSSAENQLAESYVDLFLHYNLVPTPDDGSSRSVRNALAAAMLPSDSGELAKSLAAVLAPQTMKPIDDKILDALPEEGAARERLKDYNAKISAWYEQAVRTSPQGKRYEEARSDLYEYLSSKGALRYLSERHLDKKISNSLRAMVLHTGFVPNENMYKSLQALHRKLCDDKVIDTTKDGDNLPTEMINFSNSYKALESYYTSEHKKLAEALDQSIKETRQQGNQQVVA